MTTKAQLKQQQADREALIIPEVTPLTGIDSAVIDLVKGLIDSDCTKAVILGVLKKKTKLNKGQLDLAVNELMPERAKSARGESLDDKFNAYCSAEKRTEEEMKVYINEIGSTNFIKFTPHLLKRGEFFNAIHDKYAQQ
jgi:hypothetical protein